MLRTERNELIEMLLATAVVDRVNYGLAEALTGRQDAGDLLEEARARGLFVTSLDAGGWFEVHGLVRDMLVAELHRRSPDALRVQHATRGDAGSRASATVRPHSTTGSRQATRVRRCGCWPRSRLILVGERPRGNRSAGCSTPSRPR